MLTDRLQKNMAIFTGLTLLVLSRLLPHPSNTAPIFSVALALSCFLPKNKVMSLGLLAFAFSDLMLSISTPYPAFGFWTFFTYSGFIAAFFLGAIFLTSRSSLLHIIGALLSSTFFFWVWTNFGVWLTTNFYAKTLAGFLACFVAAIPFLNNALMGNLVWGAFIFTPLWLSRKQVTPMIYSLES